MRRAERALPAAAKLATVRAMRWWLPAAALFVGCGAARGPDVGDGGAEAAIGLEFAQQRGCPTCHQPRSAGAAMAGDVMPLAGTTSYASNLTPDRTTGIGDWADEQIIRAFRFGIDAAGNELCPAMPRFPTIGDVEAHAIVAYLRGLPPIVRAIPPSLCPPVKPQPSPDMAMAPIDM